MAAQLLCPLRIDCACPICDGNYETVLVDGTKLGMDKKHSTGTFLSPTIIIPDISEERKDVIRIKTKQVGVIFAILVSLFVTVLQFIFDREQRKLLREKVESLIANQNYFPCFSQRAARALLTTFTVEESRLRKFVKRVLRGHHYNDASNGSKEVEKLNLKYLQFILIVCLFNFIVLFFFSFSLYGLFY